jgi:hypothetical protein
MDLSSVMGVLNDLPSTFRRAGPPYTQFLDSVTMALCRFTEAADATETQIRSWTAGPVDGWLDVWGLLFGVPRYPNESNIPYYTRVQRTVQAWVATVPAVQIWVQFYAAGGVVTENVGSVGYTITIPASLSVTLLRQFLSSFNRIRPAGVPFAVYQIGLGTYLGTVDFTADGMIVGDYLALGTQALPLNLDPMTLSNRPLLPMTIATDPVLNPG